MHNENGVTAKTFRLLSSIMDYEALFSKPGIGEIDSNFIWASKFVLPIGIGFVRDKIFFNLFLPEDSKSEGDMNIFLNRVRAKPNDGLWQVRREMDQTKGTYGGGLKAALLQFRSMILLRSYIKGGRIYTHFLCNSADLKGGSKLILSLPKSEEDLRVEFIRRTKGNFHILSELQDFGDVYALTFLVRDTKQKKSEGMKGEETVFALGLVQENGVRAVGSSMGNNIPEILEAKDVNSLGGSVLSFNTHNKLLIRLMEYASSEYIVIYGFYGIASGDTITMTLSTPRQQTAPIMRLIRELSSEFPSLDIRLVEILSSKEIGI